MRDGAFLDLEARPRGAPGTARAFAERRAERYREMLRADEEFERLLEGAREAALALLRREPDAGRERVAEAVESWVLAAHPEITARQQAELVDVLVDELSGYGPVQHLLDDPEVSDVVIHSWRDVTYERRGLVFDAEARFRSESHLRLLVERLCYAGRRRADESQPYVVLSTPEGWRVTVAIPPAAPETWVAIRKFVWVPTLEEMAAAGLIPGWAAEFLAMAARGRLNICFTGGMGTGKTTMIAVLGRHFGPDEYPLLVEEVQECPLECRHLRRLVARPPNVEGKGEIKLAWLLKLALTSRATRILVSEVKDGAAFYMVQAMMVGLAGSMTTFHANNARDAIETRLPAMLQMAEETRGMKFEDMQLLCRAAPEMVVHIEKNREGRRLIMQVSEVQPPGEEAPVRDVFVRLPDGRLAWTGHMPRRWIEAAAPFGEDVEGFFARLTADPGVPRVRS